MKTIYMHIGTPKTGTSALQQFFVENAMILKKYGINYPLSPSGEISAPNIGYIINNKCSVEEKARRIMSLFGEHDKLLISSEGIYIFLRYNKEFFLKFIDMGIDVKVIVYLRRQEEYLESMIRQKVKEGIWITNQDKWSNLETEDKQDESFIKRVEEEAHYLKGLESISEVIGYKNVIVRVYEKCRMKNGNIFADFLDILGIEMTDEFITQKKLINPSLDNSTLEIKRLINEACKNRITDENFLQKITLKALLNVSSYKDERGKNKNISMQLSSEQVRRIRNIYEEENKEIAMKFLNREDEPLFYYNMSDTDHSSGGVSDRELLEDTIQVLFNIILDLKLQLISIENQVAGWNQNRLQEQFEKLELRTVESIKQLELERDRLAQMVVDKQGGIDAIKGGYSWKITAPLRKIRRIIKR